MFRTISPLPRAILSGVAGAFVLTGVLVNFGDGTQLPSHLPAAEARGAAATAPAELPGSVPGATAVADAGSPPWAQPNGRLVPFGRVAIAPDVQARYPRVGGVEQGLTATPTPTPPPPPTWLQVPYRTQYDGTTWSLANCGPASVGMVLEFFGQSRSTDDLRQSLNGLTGVWSASAGIAWEPLQLELERNGLATFDLRDGGGGYRQWTVDDLVRQAEAGRPTLVLLRYFLLPGHEAAGWDIDHYIVFLGQTPDGQLVYHDPAFDGSGGSYRMTDRATFEHAWSNTWIGQNRTAMAVGRP